MGIRCIQGDQTIHVPTEGNHGPSKIENIIAKMIQVFDGGCGCAEAAPLGKTEPELMFRKKVRIDRDRRKRRTPIAVTSVIFPAANRAWRMSD